MKNLFVILSLILLSFNNVIAQEDICNGETWSIEYDYDITNCLWILDYYTGDLLNPDKVEILMSENRKKIEITNNGTKGTMRVRIKNSCEDNWFNIWITLYDKDENLFVDLPAGYTEGEELVFAGGEKVTFRVRPEHDQDMICQYDGGYLGIVERGCAYFSSNNCNYLNEDYNIDITMLGFTEYQNNVNLKFYPTNPPCQDPLIIPVYTILAPKAPTGPTDVNSETEEYTYYIPNYDSKAKDYVWEIEPLNAGQVVSHDNNWAKIVWKADYYRTANIKVAPKSETGTGNFSESKEVKITGKPGSVPIYGPNEICYSEGINKIEYSSDFTGYDIQWTVSGTGATITENPNYEYKATVTINASTNNFTVKAQPFHGTNPGPITEKDVIVNESVVDIDFSNANTCSGQGEIPVTGILPSGGNAWVQNYKREIDEIVSKHYQITNDEQAVTAFYDDIVKLGRYESTTWDNYIKIDLSNYHIGMPVRNAYVILKIPPATGTHFNGENILFGIQVNEINLGNVESVWVSGKSKTVYNVPDYNESTSPTEIKINISHLIPALKSNQNWGIYFEYRQETNKNWSIYNLFAYQEEFKPSFEIEYYNNYNKINTNSPVGTSYSVLYEIEDGGCKAAETQSIRIKEMPISLFNAPSYCPEEIPAILTGGSANLSGIGRYIGDNVNDGEYFISNSPGRYNVKYEFTAINGCKTQSTDDVIVFDSPDFDIYSVDKICGGNEILASVPNQSNYKRIIWDFEGNNISAGSISFTPDRSYSGYKHIEVDVTDLNGCQNTITKDIEIFETPMLSMNNQTVCENSFLTYYPEIVSISDGSKLNYQWSTGAITDHINLLVQRPQNISLNITSVNGCSASDDMSINMLNIPYVSVNDDEICYGESTSLKATPYLPSWSYEWSNGIRGNEITFVPNNSGENEYVVWVTDENGCVNSASSNVFVNSLPEFSLEDQNVCLGDIATISAPYGFRNYKWNTGVTGAYTINIKPNINQLISCEIQDFNGCSNSSSMVTLRPPTSFIKLMHLLS